MFSRYLSSKISTGLTLFIQQRFVSRNWKVLGLNHVAIATNNVDKASNIYKNILKMETSNSQSLPEHGVNTIFINTNNTKLELLDPVDGEKSPIWGFLEKNKSGGIHHLCLEVDDINAAIQDLKKNGIRLLGNEPKIGAHGKPVIFLHPKDCNGVLIELEQA